MGDFFSTKYQVQSTKTCRCGFALQITAGFMAFYEPARNNKYFSLK